MYFFIIVLIILVLYELWDRYNFRKQLKREREDLHAQAAKQRLLDELEHRRLLERRRQYEEQRKIAEEEKQKKEEAQKVSMQRYFDANGTNQENEDSIKIKAYFNGYYDIRRTALSGNYWLVPLHKSTIVEDINQIAQLAGDLSTEKCMPFFCDTNNKQFIKAYLQNTYQCTEMGIAFGYAIRETKSFNPMRMEYGPLLGFIKVTSPSHNRVTNNFDGWLIDFVMLPEYRKKRLMKMSVARILEKLEDFKVTKVYAMVDNDNIGSLKVLVSNGFSIATKNAGVNPYTNKPYSILSFKY